MLKVRPADERGHFQADWLNSYHTFSFSTYYDPAHMGFRALRVINEDRVQPGGGFPVHPHRNMEILSLVLSGSLKHEDSSGNSEIIPAGGVQLISAGTGVQHSEYNPSSDDEVHFLQIWVQPAQENLEPGYQFAEFDLRSEPDNLIPLANSSGSRGAVTIHQDVSIAYLELSRGGRLEKELAGGRYAWVQVTVGVVDVSGVTLRAGDGLAISDVQNIIFSSAGGGELLLFDLA